MRQTVDPGNRTRAVDRTAYSDYSVRNGPFVQAVRRNFGFANVNSFQPEVSPT